MNEMHEYVSFCVEKGGTKYCIHLINVIHFVSKKDVKVFHEKSNTNYNGITMIKNQIYNIVNTEKAFEIKKLEWKTSIIMNIGNKEIVIPVYSINGIFKTNKITKIDVNNKKFNFIVKDDDLIHVLVENYFFN